MSDDDAMVAFARELVGDVAATRLLDVLLTDHSDAGRTLAGARWNKIPPDVEGRDVQGVLRHPQSSTALLDLGGGHFAEHSGGKAGPVMHSDQFSPQAMASTGWQYEAAPGTPGGTEAVTPSSKDGAKPAGEGADSADKSADKVLVSKASVHYRKADNPEQCCHTCDMSYGPEDSRKCKLVMGQIYPTDTCDRWEAKSAGGDGDAAQDNGLPAGEDHAGKVAQRPRSAPVPAAVTREHVGDKLAAALASGQATDEAKTIDGRGQIWNPERASAHREIVGDALHKAVPVPSERRAILLGGLGSGKPAALAKAGAYDAQRHAVVSTDDIKAELGKRGMVPEVEGLTPAQSGVLVHHEASHIANLMIGELAARGKNMVIDGSMARGHPQDRVADLHRQGYDVRGIHVHTPVDKAVDQARSEGGKGKFVPAETIRAAAGSHGTDATSAAFDELTPKLDGWQRWDHSGAAPVPVSKGGKPEPPQVRAVEDLLRGGPGGGQ